GNPGGWRRRRSRVGLRAAGLCGPVRSLLCRDRQASDGCPVVAAHQRPDEPVGVRADAAGGRLDRLAFRFRGSVLAGEGAVAVLWAGVQLDELAVDDGPAPGPGLARRRSEEHTSA